MNLKLYLQKEFPDLNYDLASDYLMNNKDVLNKLNGLHILVAMFETNFDMAYEDYDYHVYYSGMQAKCRGLFYFINDFFLSNMDNYKSNLDKKELAPIPVNHIVNNTHNVCPVREGNNINFYTLEYDQYHTSRFNPISMMLFLKHQNKDLFTEAINLIEEKCRYRVQVFRDNDAFDGYHLHLSVDDKKNDTKNQISFIKDVVSTVWKLINL